MLFACLLYTILDSVFIGLYTPGRRKSARLHFREPKTKATAKTAINKPERKGKSELEKFPSVSLSKKVVDETRRVNQESDDDFFPPVPKKKRIRDRSKRQLIPCTVPDCKRKYFFHWKIKQHIFLVSHKFMYRVL